MLLGGDVRVHIVYNETGDESEHTMKDALERRSRLHFAQSSFSRNCEITRRNAAVARSGRRHSVAREPLQDATMRSGKLTQDIAGCNDEVRRLLFRQASAHEDTTVTVVQAGNECQLTAYMSLHGNLCYGGLLRGCVVQPSFSLRRLTRCLRNMRHPTRWLWYGRGNGARCVSRKVTQHRVSAYS